MHLRLARQAEILQIPMNAWADAKIALLGVCQAQLRGTAPLSSTNALTSLPVQAHLWFIPINHKDKLYINMTAKLKLEVAPTMKQKPKELQSNLLKIGLK